MSRQTKVAFVVAAALMFSIQLAMAYFLGGILRNSQELGNQIAEQKAVLLETDKRLEKRIDEVSRPPTVEAVTIELKDKVAAEIIDRVAKILVETPSYRDLLKGAQGDDGEDGVAPSLSDVVK